MVALWIYLCTLLTCAGWLLSALHSLNSIGYLLTLGLGAGAGWIFRRSLGFNFRPDRFRARWRRWRSRLFPLAFFCIAGLVILGGLIHPPSNYDGLAYRTPRILHWLAEGQWHWIHTDFERLNTRATGYEWIAAPILLFTHSVRPTVLIGIVSFLLLPGLVFSVFTRLGISRRAAWHWMWLAPTGYCFTLQAGGIGNDIFGATLGLAAFAYALRAYRSQAFTDVAWSLLAIGLMTGAKPSNIPLALPCLLPLLPSWRLCLQRPVAILLIGIAAAASSFLPMAALNYRQCSDWTGAKAEGAWMAKGDPRVTLPGNAVLLTAQNLVPPVFPLANKWNKSAFKLWPGDFHEKMRRNFEIMGADILLPEMQNEEAAGLGLGVSGLALLSLVVGIWHRWRSPSRQPARNRPAPAWLRAGPLVAAFAYCYKATLGTTARIFAPYYLFLLPLFLAQPYQGALTRQRWWRWTAVLVFLMTAGLLVLTPSRPLWPAQTVIGALLESRPGHPLLQRAYTVYSVYGIRARGLAPVREKLPASETKVGLVTFDDLETSLWLPFGSRRFFHITTRDSLEDVRKLGLRYAVLNGEWFPGRTGMEIQDWLEKYGAQIEATIPLRLRAGRSEFNWYIVRFAAVP